MNSIYSLLVRRIRERIHENFSSNIPSYKIKVRRNILRKNPFINHYYDHIDNAFKSCKSYGLGIMGTG